jgi:hypothetical protein
VNAMLTPSTGWQRVLFAVPRAVALVVMPFPRFDVWSYWDLSGGWRAASRVSSQLTMVMALLLVPFWVEGLRKGLRAAPELRMAFLAPFGYFVVGMIGAANGTMMLHERWRTSMWPIALLCAVVGGRSSVRYLPLAALIAVSGGVVFFALKG